MSICKQVPTLVRKGKRGLYYEKDGKLCRNGYNMAFAPFWTLYLYEVKEMLKYEVTQALEEIWGGVQGILFFILFLIIPIFRVRYGRKEFSNVKPDIFDKDYYEVVKWNEVEDEV